MKRRDFLKTATGTAAVLAAPHVVRAQRAGVFKFVPQADLAVLDGDYRDEAVVVRGAGPDYCTVYFVFENYDARILTPIHDERISAMQYNIVAIARIELHERLATLNPPGPSGNNISKLKHRVVGNSIEIMVAINQAGHTLLDYIEERVECLMDHVLRISHNFTSRLRMRRAHGPAATVGIVSRSAVSSCQDRAPRPRPF